jgi:death-on-curing protein
LPNNPIQFLSLDEVLIIHERLIEVFGGPAGIRDMGLLESALYRPQTGYYDDIVQMATALFESLLMNHPFVDGNKRAAFFVTDIFLRLNGYRIEVDSKCAHAFIVGLLESNQVDFDSLVTWIKNHIVNLKP